MTVAPIAMDRQKPTHSVWPLIAIALPQPFGMNMVLPALPAIRNDIGLSVASAQLTVSWFVAGMAIGQVMLGSLSDRVGRRPVLLAGLVMFSLASLLCAITDSSTILLFCRFLQGAGGVAGVAMARAMLRDRYGDRQAARYLSFLLVGMSVGPVAGPFFGGLIVDRFGWREIFVALGLINTVSLAIGWWFCAETRSKVLGGEGVPPTMLVNIKRLVMHPRFRLSALAQTFAGAAYFSMIVAVGEVGRQMFALASTEIGLYYLLCALGTTAGAFISGLLVVRLGVVSVGCIGCCVAVLFAAGAYEIAVLFPHRLLPVFAMLALAQTGISILLPSATAAALNAKPDLAGAASGLAASLQLMFGSAVVYVSGRLFEAQIFSLPISVAALSIASFTIISAGMLLAAARPFSRRKPARVIEP